MFGNRPSHNIVSLDHAMPLSEHLDTAGFLTRDPYLWDVAQSVMYGDNYTSFVSGTSDVVYPTTIYTVDFPTTASSDADTILINFANKIASFIGSNTTALDLNSAWLSSNVTGASDASLDEFLNTTYPVLITKEQTALVRDPFYADYAGESRPGQLLMLTYTLLNSRSKIRQQDSIRRSEPLDPLGMGRQSPRGSPR